MSEAGVSTDLVEVPSRGRLAVVAAVLLALVVAGLVWVLARSEPSTDRGAYSALEGQPAPPLAGEQLTAEGDFDIDQHLGSWVVVNFFATWCPPCIEEHPELVALDEAYGPSGEVVLVSVVFDDSASDVRSFFDRHGGDWPVIADPNGRIALDFEVLGVPETYLVDPRGVVRQKIVGGVTRAGLEGFMAQIAAESANGEGAP